MLTGWNTWDTYNVTSVAHMPSGLNIRAGVLNLVTGEYRDQILLPDMPAGKNLVGPRTADGAYIEWRVQQSDFRILLQFTSDKESMVWRITPEVWSKDLMLVLKPSFPWGGGAPVIRDGEVWRAGSFFIRPLSNIEESISDGIAFDLNRGDALVSADSGPVKEMKIEAALVKLKTARTKCVQDELQSEGYLRSAAQGLSRGAFWNTIWEPLRNRPLPTFSRRWNVSFGGFVDAPADNFAQAASTGHFHEHLAYLNIEEMITEANSKGMIPNIGAANGTSIDRSEPPNGSHSALKLYRNYGDKSFLERVYPGLARWNRWWYSERDGNKDGIFEWGSDPLPDPDNRYYGVTGKQRALWELCADNSSVYDDVEYNEEAHTLEMSDVGLNAYLALDAWSLAEIARILGYADGVKEFEEKYNILKQKINDELWNEEQGTYLNKHWDGRWCMTCEPQLFFTLTAGIVPPDRAQRMVENYLLNEKKLWGEYPLPSVSRDNPAFQDNDYYRGRIWGEQVHIVTEGLHRYQMDDVAYDLSKKLLKMYLKEWEGHSHSHENYNSVTGEGDDVENATCDYAALGGIMSFAAIQQLVDVEAWGGLRFGNLSDEHAKVSNVTIGGSRWDVETGNGLRVYCNGKLVIESGVPVIIRGLQSPAFSPSVVELDLKSVKPGTLQVYDLIGEAEVKIISGGEIQSRSDQCLTIILAP